MCTCVCVSVSVSSSTMYSTPPPTCALPMPCTPVTLSGPTRKLGPCPAPQGPLQESWAHALHPRDPYKKAGPICLHRPWECSGRVVAHCLPIFSVMLFPIAVASTMHKSLHIILCDVILLYRGKYSRCGVQYMYKHYSCMCLSVVNCVLYRVLFYYVVQ